MEVGAVKQAFNNELIRLKKNLNQAKIQIIHKLTRKAKTLSEKKAPEKLKEKLKRKSESAISEVLIIKKIKIRELAKFMLTHTGELNSFLNKPIVDTDKACARLLLHKNLNDKYKFIRTRFASVPINDLLMSREERKKLKKEAKEKQKNKKKSKDTKIQLKDDTEMADVEKGKEFSDDDSDVSGSDHDDEDNGNNSDAGGDEAEEDNESEIEHSDTEDNKIYSDEDNEIDLEENNEIDLEGDNKVDFEEDIVSEKSDEDSDKIEPETGKFVKPKPVENNYKPAVSNIKKPIAKTFDSKVAPLKEKILIKKTKDGNKNKNLNEKLVSRKFKKVEEAIVTENKVVDPFFKTATGENYLSVAEPRQPDEFKEVHRQGNRKLRRAVMFGHAPKNKPRYNNYENDRFNKQNNFTRNDNFKDNDNKFNKGFNRGDRFNKNDNGNEINNFNKIDHKASKSFKSQAEAKPEKLHPSWEAKKKQSGILPFQGKKIVFNDG